MGTPPPSPHVEYDRWIARQARWDAWWRRFGQIAFYVVASTMTITLAALLVASLIDLGQPRIWGAFTQTGCEERFRGGCRPFGTWVSDDRTIIESHVYLNGGTDDFGRARAAFQPTALLGDDVVNVAPLDGAMPVVIGAVSICWTGYTLYKAAAWEDLPRPRSRWLGGRGRARPQGALDIRGSFRRQYRQSLDRAMHEAAVADPKAP